MRCNGVPGDRLKCKSNHLVLVCRDGRGKCDIGLNRTGGCIEEMGSAAYDVEQLMGLRIHVRISIRNTGNRQGKEVVQLYVKSPGKLIDRPLKELKGYEKPDLAPGEE